MPLPVFAVWRKLGAEVSIWRWLHKGGNYKTDHWNTVIEGVLFEPILSNFTEDGIVTYCSNPTPTAFVISSSLEQE